MSAQEDFLANVLRVMRIANEPHEVRQDLGVMALDEVAQGSSWRVHSRHL
jgi:hypothetical protein